ncbi:tapasin-related protein [Tachysurus fulvidraco]|uniref:tapasin-related protein n=1 Tax=Tachysurus fulvidraco TaxID=1234273 RepID=UPI001FF0618D|nr:tapasin-related protein [Tachysurus fulvidraco]XP_027005572.2 tapasin-related protein [Tachysurus fulvidraco]
MLEIFFLASLHALTHSVQVADVVLSCSYIEEGGGITGSHFIRSPATMVLRDLPMSADLSAEAITPYVHPDTPNADDLIFEATALSVEIPEAESLLHADCNEQEVTCELSHYIPRGTKPDSVPVYFIASVQLEGGGVGFTLVLQIITNENPESNTASLIQSKLQLPLSQWGTLITDVVFVVFSRSPSVAAAIGEDIVLDCGYRQRDTPPVQNLGLEWRWQYRGQGKTILDMKETEAGSILAVDREETSANSTLLVRDGNASLTMMKLKVSDEGTYICTISSAPFQTQQIVQLNIIQPPRVSFDGNKITFQDEAPKRLSCHCERYYPLDVEVEWFCQLPSETESISLTDGSSLSSHRQHSDGTFSLSSFLVVRPTEYPPGTVFTCRVSHIGLQTPSDVSLTVLKPDQIKSMGEYYWMILATLILSILFLYQALR